MNIRLQKFMSEAGICSRRKAEELINEGKITVNGETAVLGVKVDPQKDKIIYDGKLLTKSSEHVYIMLHKPEGYITTAIEEFSRPAVTDLIKDIKTRLYPVGRLDYDSSGLLLLTNDGDLTYKLTHPKHNIEKIYVARVKGVPTEDEMEMFRNGLEIEGQITARAGIEIIKSDTKYTSVKITLWEGRNRQVRKMCDAINHPVASLKRVATGKLFLGALPKGEYRKLTKREIEYLKGI